MDRLARLRYAAEHFPALQGLRIVPFGIAFLILSAVQPGLQWFPTGSAPSWDLGVPLLTFAAAILASVGLKGYYERAFGVHRPLPRGKGLWGGVGAFALLGAVMAMGARRVEGIEVLWAVPFALAFMTAPRLRWYYGVAVLASALLAVLPAFGVGSPWGFFGQNSRFHYLMLGLTFTVCGLLDHRLLRELFEPCERETTLVQSI
jgi:hypothetical protein